MPVACGCPDRRTSARRTRGALRPRPRPGARIDAGGTAHLHVAAHGEPLVRVGRGSVQLRGRLAVTLKVMEPGFEHLAGSSRSRRSVPPPTVRYVPPIRAQLREIDHDRQRSLRRRRRIAKAHRLKHGLRQLHALLDLSTPQHHLRRTQPEPQRARAGTLRTCGRANVNRRRGCQPTGEGSGVGELLEQPERSGLAEAAQRDRVELRRTVRRELVARPIAGSFRMPRRRLELAGLLVMIGEELDIWRRGQLLARGEPCVVPLLQLRLDRLGDRLAHAVMKRVQGVRHLAHEPAALQRDQPFVTAFRDLLRGRGAQQQIPFERSSCDREQLEQVTHRRRRLAHRAAEHLVQRRGAPGLPSLRVSGRSSPGGMLRPCSAPLNSLLPQPPPANLDCRRLHRAPALPSARAIASGSIRWAPFHSKRPRCSASGSGMKTRSMAPCGCASVWMDTRLPSASW